MTREEAKEVISRHHWAFASMDDEVIEAIECLAEECEDTISRQAVLDLIADYDLSMGQVVRGIHALPSVTPKQKMGRCKDCKYFEYDSVANVNGMPLIVAHEICSKWGRGCKTKGYGYCFMFEPRESEDNK